MSKINLRDYYPYYNSDSFVEVSDEVIAAMKPYRTEDQTQRRMRRRYKVYSLDVDRTENGVVFTALSPCELYERKLTYQELYSAIASLPDKQAKRIYAHFFLRMSMSEIAKVENVSKAAIGSSIARALKQIEKIFSNPHYPR